MYQMPVDFNCNYAIMPGSERAADPRAKTVLVRLVGIIILSTALLRLLE